jgi:hypothetical protein
LIQGARVFSEDEAVLDKRGLFNVWLQQNQDFALHSVSASLRTHDGQVATSMLNLFYSYRPTCLAHRIYSFVPAPRSLATPSCLAACFNIADRTRGQSFRGGHTDSMGRHSFRQDMSDEPTRPHRDVTCTLRCECKDMGSVADVLLSKRISETTQGSENVGGLKDRWRMHYVVYTLRPQIQVYIAAIASENLVFALFCTVFVFGGCDRSQTVWCMIAECRKVNQDDTLALWF